MGSLAIVPPITLDTTQASGTAYDPLYVRMLTADPKEAFVIPAGKTLNVFVDFGVATDVDSFYVGYHNAADPTPGQQTFRAATTSAYGPGATETAVPVIATSLAPLGYGTPFHFFVRTASPTTGRYWKFTLANASASDFYVGIFATGLAVQMSYGTEWGAGRLLEDTGSVERLFGGGFGITDGVAATGYQWTFGDLQPDETRRLYQLARRRRTTRTILVVEDPDFTDGLNERCHWGVFATFEPYERLDPANTKWSLKIRDWA